MLIYYLQTLITPLQHYKKFKYVIVAQNALKNVIFLNKQSLHKVTGGRIK